MASQTNRSPTRSLILILAGPIAWAVQFLVMYGAQSSMCAFGTGVSGASAPLRLVLIAATLVTAMTCLILVLRPTPLFHFVTGRHIESPPDHFVSGVSRLLAGLSGLAIFLAGAVALVLPLCDGLR